jgi:hypothetical protein
MTEPGRKPREGAGGYLSLTVVVVTLACGMAVGWAIAGSTGMWAGAAAVVLLYAVGIWRALPPSQS